MEVDSHFHSKQNQSCPLEVVQEDDEYWNGLPLMFFPVNAKGTIRVSTDVNIKFDTEVDTCVEPTVWRVGAFDKEVRQDFVKGGGFIGSPVYCKVMCKNLGIYEDSDGVKRLALSETSFKLVAMALLSLLVLLPLLILDSVASVAPNPALLDEVSDIANKKLVSGVEYYIVPAPGASVGGGLTLYYNTTRSCYLEVAQEDYPTWDGFRIQFFPVDPKKGMAGGSIGNPGPETLRNWFKIEKYEDAYKLSYCPSVCRFCKVMCKDLGTYVDSGVKKLALSEKPLKVVRGLIHRDTVPNSRTSTPRRSRLDAASDAVSTNSSRPHLRRLGQRPQGSHRMGVAQGKDSHGATHGVWASEPHFHTVGTPPGGKSHGVLVA
ncbi:hypothetical protein Sjap_011672 [Stephania japonica]|uniref:Uncharacterized protein n=1 Tax=Stephania japonica TaxID=461633 RepID=A0AAP0P7L2_9MAGN